MVNNSLQQSRFKHLFRTRQLCQQKYHPRGRDPLPRRTGARRASPRHRSRSRLWSLKVCSLEEGARTPALGPYSAPQAGLPPASRLTPSAPEGARRGRRPAPSCPSAAAAHVGGGGRLRQARGGRAYVFGGKAYPGILTPEPLTCPARPPPS